ncbi:hypothetical protein BOSE62_71411 [Bosea sp. 62]|nr:hypothetical protein BOSE21B_90208 [Bosea sp. 21B]CAD5294798.1 hypothetical protein BOSE46_80312 [Bosea sp. 46]CAD5298845.1 hypothetical protein BOSE7B_60457 [Bosea sp. 7B]VVT60855.1 hypothetical protein BOS5A_230132 [Bosea sp. EC-HK365B]VXB38722.1 hypothetical protein BOSE127_110455 [Bosea sp. 127]VXB55272.1 hypothetical protein BOSE125_131060 [Bosea sp. 125]VXC75061.1 hypothetical protein BOSE29B_80202 [Bosea sp. 29B]VXC91302.1 hypothetical protein BOSE62_71411 [Bosea sp. 62]
MLSAQGRLEPLGDGAEKCVACGMSMGVIDLFEMVEIKPEQAEVATTDGGFFDRFLQLGAKQPEVWQTGQGIMVCQMSHALSRRLLRTNIPHLDQMQRWTGRGDGRRAKRDVDANPVASDQAPLAFNWIAHSIVCIGDRPSDKTRQRSPFDLVLSHAY